MAEQKEALSKETTTKENKPKPQDITKINKRYKPNKTLLLIRGTIGEYQINIIFIQYCEGKSSKAVNKGNKDVFVMIEIPSRLILALPTPNKTQPVIVEAFETLGFLIIRVDQLYHNIVGKTSLHLHQSSALNLIKMLHFEVRLGNYQFIA